jgi:quinol monooxygenase YgiN
MPFVLTATWTAKPGHEETVHQAILKLIEPSRAEPGNLLYQPHRHPEDPRVFFFYEQYTDEAALQAHAESEHFREHALETAIPLLESRVRVIYEPLG